MYSILKLNQTVAYICLFHFISNVLPSPQQLEKVLCVEIDISDCFCSVFFVFMVLHLFYSQFSNNSVQFLILDFSVGPGVSICLVYKKTYLQFLYIRQ